MSIGHLITKMIRLVSMKSNSDNKIKEEVIEMQNIINDSLVTSKQEDILDENPLSQESTTITSIDYSEHYELNHLVLERFCGEEEYPLINAEYQIFEGDKEESEPDSLWLEMQFDEGTKLHEDTASLNECPNWEVSFSASPVDLKPGVILEFENDEQDSEAIMYYCEHIPTLTNKMEIIDTNGDELLIKVSGLATDVNYYDGSKPQNQLRVLAWFKRKEAKSK